jgi:methyl-accepting chemotaxis protein
MEHKLMPLNEQITSLNAMFEQITSNSKKSKKEFDEATISFEEVENFLNQVLNNSELFLSEFNNIKTEFNSIASKNNSLNEQVRNIEDIAYHINLLAMNLNLESSNMDEENKNNISTIANNIQSLSEKIKNISQKINNFSSFDDGKKFQDITLPKLENITNEFQNLIENSKNKNVSEIERIKKIIESIRNSFSHSSQIQSKSVVILHNIKSFQKSNIKKQNPQVKNSQVIQKNEENNINQCPVKKVTRKQGSNSEITKNFYDF